MKVRQTIALVALGWTAACGGAQRESQAPPSQPAATEPAATEHGIERGEPNTAPRAEEVTEGAAKEETDTPQDLTSATRSLDSALDAEELSCAGAKGYVDAICRIAERLCDVSARQPSSSAQPRDCDDARSECARSQERYAERCSE